MIKVPDHQQEQPQEELLSVSRENILEHAEDFDFLRQEGIRLVELLAGNVWTDYNATDPGITLLEAMCYALTDLGYRTAMDIPDLVAPASGGDSPAALHGQEQRVFASDPLAHEILPSHPLTIADYRKLIIDTEGVRNAYIEPTYDNEIFLYYSGGEELTYVPGNDTRSVQLRGLYRVLVEFEYAVEQSKRQKEVITDIRRRLQAHRNLCEDFAVISEVEVENVPLYAELVVHEGADIERIAAEIFNLIQNSFTPGIPFYSLWQLQHNGLPTEDIFDGPLLKHGFIDTEELNASTRQRKILLSDLINPILSINGVIAIQRFARKDHDSPFFYFGERPGEEEASKKMQKMLRVDIEESTISFVRSGDRHRNDRGTPDKERVLALYSFLQSQQRTTKLKKHHNHIEAPVGTFMDISRYHPFQQTLPACYLDERKLPLAEEAVQIMDRWDEPGVRAIIQTDAPLDEAGGREAGGWEAGGRDNPFDRDRETVESSIRRKQVLQLKAFLMVFEQIMADYCARLSNIGRLFSGEPLTQTHFPGILYQVPDAEKLFLDLPGFRKRLLSITESNEEYLEQRNAILDHLLARVGERIDRRSMYPGSNRTTAEKALIQTKEIFLKEYIQMSKHRGRGFNYTNKQEVWDTGNVAGVKQRVCGLLGMADHKTGYLTQDWITTEKQEHTQGPAQQVVIVRDEKSGRELLKSKGYESDSEIRTILEFILRHGGDRKFYKLDESRGRHYYQLRRMNTEEEEDVIAERHFDDPKERDDHFEELTGLLGGFLKKENFHLVEHLLLRPRLEPQEQMGVQLLLPRVIPEGAAPAMEKPRIQPYQFKRTRKKIAGNKEVLKLSLVIKTKGEPVLFTIEEDFQLMEDLVERERLIREAGADETNYVPDRDADGRNIFHLKDKKRLLAKGNKNYSKAEMEKEIADLVAFFSYEQTWQNEMNAKEEEQETMTADADPYSLQVSYFIPAWPERFIDPAFRHVMEKCITGETPAHVLPRIYWLDYKEMKDFEAAYKPWLENMAEDGIPATAVVNNLVNIMNQFSRSYQY
jgi:hypothetical protein